MSGHSKWHSIKHKKAAVDAKRGAMFTKIIKEIVVAARMGGGDPNGNPRLRSAIQAARDVSMPKDNIERAIKKGSGELQGVSYEDFCFEGYGQGGVAILVEGTTDNKHRTTPEIRHIFQKYGGNMGEIGCVGWMFKKKGIIRIPTAGLNEDQVMEAAIEAGADDFENQGEFYQVVTGHENVQEVREALEAKKIPIESSAVENIPENTIKVEGEEARKLLKLIEMLEENDDVSSVSANYEIDDALIEQMSE
ncbi:MAG: YebC/PmpR family DNA-binding transcriptional regulator [bacterium]|nr:YebC/PmpR family DNA-binding transcriptional regulator [bacterium]